MKWLPIILVVTLTVLSAYLITGCSEESSISTISYPTVAKSWKGAAHQYSPSVVYQLTAVFSQNNDVISGVWIWEAGVKVKVYFDGNINQEGIITLQETKYEIIEGQVQWILSFYVATLNSTRDTISGSWATNSGGQFYLVRQW